MPNFFLFFLLLLKLWEFNQKTRARKKNFCPEEFKIRLLPDCGIGRRERERER